MGKPVDLLYVDRVVGDSIHQSTIRHGPRIQEIVNQRKNGESFPSLLAASPLLDASGQVIGVMGISRDITERKLLEAQSLRAQRLESLGALAGGIAHDLNNVLAPILMSLHMLRAKYTGPSDDRLLNTIEPSVQRGADMVKQILAFVRGVQGERASLGIGPLLRELARILTPTFPKMIQIRTAASKDLWPVIGDATQLHQVLLNLCVNARDAMPNGGTLTIEASNLLIDEPYVAMQPEAKVGPYLVVRVADTGVGMPGQVRARIFEPFFTTKAADQGSGLGLATALHIVKSHNGFITVYSEPERGTEFKVYLPAEQFANVCRSETETHSLPVGNGELVLVVDDEAAILDIAKQTLQMFGYEVLTASDGAEAVAVCSQHRGRIKILITDMMMPVMEGPAAIRAALEIDPLLKVIGTSGLGSRTALADAVRPHMHAFLQKPFTAESLLKAAHRVLQPRELKRAQRALN